MNCKIGGYINTLFLMIIVSFCLCGCTNHTSKKEVFTINAHGDYVSDKFKVEYNDKNDITLISDSKYTEKFNYTYDDVGRVKKISINTNSETVPDTTFNIDYYDNGKIFSLISNNTDNIKTTQYYLYKEDKLSCILQDTTLYNSSMSRNIIIFNYIEYKGNDYVIESIFNVLQDGKFSGARLYSAQSINNYKNNLEKLGITTELMFKMNYNRLDRNTLQGPNLYQMPIGAYYFSDKVLARINSNKNDVIKNIFDKNGYFIYTDNDGSSLKQILTKSGDTYIRKELDKYENKQYTYKYYIENGRTVKMEFYSEQLSSKKIEELWEEYRITNASYTNDVPYAELSKYYNTKIQYLSNIYQLFLDLINKNGKKYSLYKYEENSNSSSNNKEETKNNSSNKTNYNYSSEETDIDSDDSSNNVQRKPEFNVSVSKLRLGSIKVTCSTNIPGDKCKIYINGIKTEEEIILLEYDKYIGSTEIYGIPVGDSIIKVDLVKDGKVVDTKTTNYNFDLSEVPTPTFVISGQAAEINYNTYADKYELYLWEDKGCSTSTDSRCELELYVNDVKQSNDHRFTVPLEIGDNIFKIELKNLFGKSSCRKVMIKRFEYDPHTMIYSKIQEMEC